MSGLSSPAEDFENNTSAVSRLESTVMRIGPYSSCIVWPDTTLKARVRATVVLDKTRHLPALTGAATGAANKCKRRAIHPGIQIRKIPDLGGGGRLVVGCRTAAADHLARISETATTSLLRQDRIGSVVGPRLGDQSKLASLVLTPLCWKL